jgi:hypothetical protein
MESIIILTVIGHDNLDDKNKMVFATNGRNGGKEERV